MAALEKTSEAKIVRMTTQPVDRLILKLAVPTIISMMVTAFYNLADTFSSVNWRATAWLPRWA